MAIIKNIALSLKWIIILIMTAKTYLHYNIGPEVCLENYYFSEPKARKNDNFQTKRGPIL